MLSRNWTDLVYTARWLVCWLGLNNTFSTNRLYRAIKKVKHKFTEDGYFE